MFIIHSPFWTINQGKSMSCSAIIFCCLNLLPHLCYCHENMFIASPPNPLSMITISYVIDPVIESTLKYSTTPHLPVPTCCVPDGVEVDIKVAPLIADLEGSCKVGGFLSTATTMFCTFCLCTHPQLEELDPLRWILCNSHDI